MTSVIHLFVNGYPVCGSRAKKLKRNRDESRVTCSQCLLCMAMNAVPRETIIDPDCFSWEADH